MKDTPGSTNKPALVISLIGGIVTIIVGALTLTFKQEADLHEATSKNLQVRLDEKEEKIETLKAQLSAAQAARAAADGTTEDWKELHENVYVQLQDKERALREESSKLAASEANYTALKREHDAAKSRIEVQHSRIAALQLEVTELKQGGTFAQQIQELETNLAAARGESASCKDALQTCKNTKVEELTQKLELDHDQLRRLALANQSKFRPFLDKSVHRFGSSTTDYSKPEPTSIEDLKKYKVFHCHKCFALTGSGWRPDLRCRPRGNMKLADHGRYRWPQPQQPADYEPYVELFEEFKRYYLYYEEAGLLQK